MSKLTKREHEVVQLLAQGMKQSQIAQKLFISRHTVYKHTSNICQKTGAQSAFELAVNARTLQTNL